MSMMFSYVFSCLRIHLAISPSRVLANPGKLVVLFRYVSIIRIAHVKAYPWRDAALNLFVPLGPAFIAQVSTGCTRERGGT